jgi:hypothetical protein
MNKLAFIINTCIFAEEKVKMQKTAAIQTLTLPMPLSIVLLHAITLVCHRTYSYSSYYYGYYYRRLYCALFGNHTDNQS